MTLRVGGSSATRSVSGKFSDPDNDTLTYSVNNPSPSYATVSISGSTVTIAPVAAGTTGKIIVTARDPGGLTATQDFTATVENPPPPPSQPNRAPTAVGSISDVTLRVGGSSATRSVSGKFSDPDNDTLTYSVNNPSPSYATVSISGSTVTIAPVAAGTTGKIIVTARDPGGLTATQDFTATVQNPPPPPPPPPPSNSPPTAVGSISDVTLRVGGSSATRSVSGKFSDPDGDTLTYSVNSPSPTIATTSISGSTVTVKPKAAGTTGKIVVTARDPGGLTATQDFTATVVNPPPPSNNAPVASGSLSDETVNIDTMPFDVPVSGEFSDPDGDSLSFSASSSDTLAATVSESDGTVTVTPQTGGATTITVTATDPGGLSASLSFTVNVNRTPTATGTLSSLSVNVDAMPFNVSISGKFSDPDGDILSYSATSSDTLAATVSESDGTLTVTPEALGTTTITVTASDSGGLSASLTFTVTVSVTGNQPPTVSWTIPDQPLERDGSAGSVILTSKFSDPDGDMLGYSATSSNTSVATVSVSGSVLTITPGVNGTSTITVIATDPGGLAASQTFTATVSRKPVTSGTIPKMILEESDLSLSIAVAVYFSDPDGEALTYSAVSLNSDIATASVTGSTVTVSRVSPGAGVIWVTATDPGGLTVVQSMTIRVINRAPVTETSITDQTLYLSNDFRRVDLAGKFSDPDGQTLAFTATSSDTDKVTVSAGGSTLLIRPVSRGSTTVTVRATDPGNRFVEQTFTATVANQYPQTVEPAIGNQTLYMLGGSRQINAAPYFSDPDGDKLSYTVTSPNPEIVTVSIASGTITLTPVSLGPTGKIRVIATDPGGLTADQDFNVSVVAGSPPATTNQVPVAQGTIEVDDLYQLGSSVVIDVTPYFSDPDSSDVLAYSVTSQDPGIVIVSMTGSSVKLTPKGPGKTGKIVVTARDPGGLTADQDFVVTVIAGAPPVPPNRYPIAVGTIAVDTLYAEGPSIKIDVATYFSDPDEDVLSYSAVSHSPAMVEASALGSEVTVKPVMAGPTGKIVVTASDPDGLTADQEFNVTVLAGAPPTPTNHAPEIREMLTEWVVTLGGGTVELNVAPYFRDVDNDSLAYELDAQGAGKATLTIADSTLSIEPHILGSTGKNQLRAVDPAGLFAEQDFVVIVVTNLAPDILMSIPDQELTVAEGPVELDLSKFFFDPDQDTLMYTAVSSDTGAATAAESGDTLTITPVKKNMSSTVTVTASDGDLSVAQEFDVTVNNSPPRVSEIIPTQRLTVATGPVELDLAAHFLDADGDTLSYAAVSSDTSVAKVAVRTDTLSITPQAEGSSTAGVTATDDDSASASQSFMVAVAGEDEDENENEPPPPSCPAAISGAPIPDQTLIVGAGTTRIDLTQHFEHIDQDGIEITVTSPSPGIATAAIEGTSLKIGPVAAGQIETVTVKVSDTAESDPCDPVSLSFMVTVEITLENPDLNPWSVSGVDVYRLEGNVGIGVEVPDQKLVVDGTIKAEGYRLRMIPADYVFEEGYDLLSLDEVEAYIRIHGHLPGVASGAEMKANGIGISRMQTTLLEKIEELSLYIIAQHEQLRVQDDRLAAQRQKLETRKKQASELEQRLRRLEE